jgi:predicted heme/steroid binding protein
MKQRKLISAVLNITVIVLAVAAWVGSIGSVISSLEIASLFGVLAFSLMWVHYVVDVSAPQDADSHDFQYYLSRGAVLLAIVTHPLLVNWYLLSQGFGYPPTSYESLLGATAWAVIIGWLALFAFVSFELRGKITRFIPQILYANIIAMFLVLIHGFVAGMFVIDGWYLWVWFFYLFTFLAIAVYHYRADQEGLFNRYVALSGIILLALGGLGAGVYSITNNKSPESSTGQSKTVKLGDTAKGKPVTPEKVVTLNELSARNGKGSNDCWVAVSGTVYDLTGNREWQNGIHIPSGGEATCGRDLTSVLGGSPHGSSVLSNLPQIGKLSA